MLCNYVPTHIYWATLKRNPEKLFQTWKKAIKWDCFWSETCAPWNSTTKRPEKSQRRAKCEKIILFISSFTTVVRIRHFAPSPPPNSETMAVSLESFISQNNNDIVLSATIPNCSYKPVNQIYYRQGLVHVLVTTYGQTKRFCRVLKNNLHKG